ncbi:MAG: twin-arginine translocase TatA/TatE family subunit [Oligoflexia bacterium]|nr:twin-arginine translocase TatA/TatE family subunit [Oligoflexia bacterium]
MFGLSLPELIVIFAVALIAFGPEKLPELARHLGKMSAQLRRASDQMRREFYNSVYKPMQDLDREAQLGTRNIVQLPPAEEPRAVPKQPDPAVVPPTTNSGEPQK